MFIILWMSFEVQKQDLEVVGASVAALVIIDHFTSLLKEPFDHFKSNLTFWPGCFRGKSFILVEKVLLWLSMSTRPKPNSYCIFDILGARKLYFWWF